VTEMLGPSPQQAKVLFDLAMMGDLDGIVEKLEQFEQDDSKLTPFANHVRELANDFKEEQICDLIEQHVISVK
ncbi:hypothetical protein QUF50_10415, partial [Thiotrichales bacterium HSG1]|nr:hypothetical protein [Thiotrichales bacterium HSG1]